MPRVWYGIQQYPSHERVATDYKRILEARYSLVEDMRVADIAILHIEPHEYERILTRYPILRSKYLVSFCVWEASDLPQAYIDSLQLVQEVWTPSEYCAAAVRKVHPRVRKIPHVMSRDLRFDAVDSRVIKRAICYDSSLVYFLTVARTRGSRKNIPGLLRSFAKCKASLSRARLLVKTLPGDPSLDLSPTDNVIDLPFFLSFAQMNALFESSHVVVSAHHSEAWGLSLSDAFLFNRPVIASRYSGNLEFMTDENSHLIESKEHSIPLEDVFDLFTTEMSWATPDEDCFAGAMSAVYEDVINSRAAKKVECAARDSHMFSEERVATLLYEEMEKIVCRL